MFALLNQNGCNKKEKSVTENKQEEIHGIDKGKFWITSLNEKDVSKEKLYMVFDPETNRISGYSGCNTFSCTYTLNDDNTISIGMAMASKMYCENNDALEREFFKALSNIKTATFSNTEITLKSDNKKEVFKGQKAKD